MNVAWLKSLAVRLRRTLAEHGVTVSHGQALDLIAAVPGLRDWPEVMAFPDRVAASRFDAEAVDRVARRVTRRHRVAFRPEMLAFSLRHMSPFYQPAFAKGAMGRLIVTSTDSGAGHLMQSGIADHVIRAQAFDSLVSGPVPAARGPAAFFVARDAVYDGDPGIEGDRHDWNRAEPALRHWKDVVALCEVFERVELWIDPTPDAQLLFVRMLCWLSAYPTVLGRLHVVHADSPIGEWGPERVGTFNPSVDRVGDEALRTAGRAWEAYCRPTPEAWFDLLTSDLDALPHLRRTVLLLLGELPAVGSAIGATERLLLEVVTPGAVKPGRFFAANAQDNPSRVYGAFDDIRIVNRLGGCREPAILGLQDPAFASTAMTDPERRKRYMQSELSLSDLGRALLEGKDDFASHNRIHRWWGGTLLTNADLWRWDAQRRRLVPPP